MFLVGMRVDHDPTRSFSRTPLVLMSHPHPNAILNGQPECLKKPGTGKAYLPTCGYRHNQGQSVSQSMAQLRARHTLPARRMSFGLHPSLLGGVGFIFRAELETVAPARPISHDHPIRA
jgi:hypothetical protein